MEQIIGWLIYLLLFAGVGWFLWWVCTKFAMPQPVFWLVGGVLLIVLLLFIARQLGISTGPLVPVR